MTLLHLIGQRRLLVSFATRGLLLMLLFGGSEAIGWAQQTSAPPTPAEIRQLRLRAEQGDVGAQWLLGFWHEYGRGVPQDDSQAVGWYRKAAEQGFASAQFSLGRMYVLGRGVAKDMVFAHMWFNLAASRQSGDDRETTVKGRDLTAKSLSPQQLADAQRRAREWQAAFEKRKP